MINKNILALRDASVVRVLALLPEDPGLNPRTHIVDRKHGSQHSHSGSQPWIPGLTQWIATMESSRPREFDPFGTSMGSRDACGA